MSFTPDFNYMLDVMNNQRPSRMPVYEHYISPLIMEKILDESFADLINGSEADQREFFRRFCQFHIEMTYDTPSFEVGIIGVMPDHGAIMGGRPGPIQSRAEFDAYPWDEIPELFWKTAKPRFEALSDVLPEGMKALGGPGNGVFEISEDLVGFEYLGLMIYEEPELVAEIFQKIGDLMVAIWSRFLDHFSDNFAVCRFGDDLGFKSSLLVNPNTVREHIIPQYRRVIDLVRKKNKPFLWHSCGCIFSIMDEVINLGINAKHSNEDAIAPFENWIEKYGDRIGLVGGIDVDILCQKPPDEVYNIVLERGRKYRSMAQGYALGSGNSIPDYVPVEGFMAMIRAAREIRSEEGVPA